MVTRAVRAAEALRYCRGSVSLHPFNRLFRQTAAVSLLGLSSTRAAGAGILTGSPSRAPLGFRLGPD